MLHLVIGVCPCGTGAGSGVADVFNILVMSHINVLKGYLSFFFSSHKNSLLCEFCISVKCFHIHTRARAHERDRESCSGTFAIHPNTMLQNKNLTVHCLQDY